MTIKRRAFLPRSTKPISRGTPPKRSAVKRKPRPKSETLRIYGPPERRAWIKSLPCMACAIFTAADGCGGPSDNAHVCGGDGIGRKKGYASIVPLGRVCHQRFDQHLAPFDTEPARQLIRALAPVVEQHWQSRANWANGATGTRRER